MGGLSAVRWWKRAGLRILTYHNFPADTVQLFDEQCRHIREHYNPVSMGQVARSLQGDSVLPPRAVALTVDDGYLDFYTQAFPVLKKYELPATVYLFTDFVDGKMWGWWNQVQFLCDQTRVHELTLPNKERRKLDTGTAEQVCEQLKKLPNSARLAYLRELPYWLEVKLPEQPPEPWRALTWNHVRELAQKGVEFGAHTKTHPILSRLEDEGLLREEIEGSQQRIREELGAAPIHFCYPNGRDHDIPGAAPAILKECGFITAVTTTAGFNSSASDAYALKRFGADPDLPFYYFKETLAGCR